MESTKDLSMWELIETISAIKDYAFQSKEKCSEHDGEDFYLGRNEAYYEVISTIRSDLESAGQDLTEFGLDFDPEDILWTAAK